MNRTAPPSGRVLLVGFPRGLVGVMRTYTLDASADVLTTSLSEEVQTGVGLQPPAVVSAGYCINTMFTKNVPGIVC